jgi:hypothetical protein
MKLKTMLLMGLALSWPWAALAQLPPPTPEEAAKKQAATEKKANDEAAGKAALARAQNRVVQRHHAVHAPAAKKPARPGEAEPISESDAAIEE